METWSTGKRWICHKVDSVSLVAGNTVKSNYNIEFRTLIFPNLFKYTA